MSPKEACGVVFADQDVDGTPKLNVGKGGCVLKDGCDRGFGLAETAATEGAGEVESPAGNIGDEIRAAGVPLSCSARNGGEPVAKDESGVVFDVEKAGNCCCD